MKRILLILLTISFCNSALAQKKEENKKGDYIEFDDRKNVVHGIYIGLSQHIGKISGELAGLTSFKIAYVANKKLEIGLVGTVFYSKQPNTTSVYKGNDVLLFGGYGGIHLEPILFGNKFVNISFPLLIGAGDVVIFEDKVNNGEFDSLSNNSNDVFFIIEPGINLLYNISRFFQLETGIKYRFSSSFSLPYYGEDNIKGFSAGIGIKIGVFNLKRQKKVKDNF